ncbi:hypothetical protein GCM10023115_04410 [Pontixanthobacter gangjinensis]
MITTAGFCPDSDRVTISNSNPSAIWNEPDEANPNNAIAAKTGTMIAANRSKFISAADEKRCRSVPF